MLEQNKNDMELEIWNGRVCEIIKQNKYKRDWFNKKMNGIEFEWKSSKTRMK